MHRFTQLLKISLILTAILSPISAFAVIYKWVDEKGAVHYGEVPPQNVNATKMRGADKTSVDPKQAMEALRSKNSEFSERREERKTSEDEATAAKKDKKDKLGFCSQLQKNLNTLNTHTQIKVTNKDGETSMIADKARLDKIADVKKQIAENCK